MAIYHLHVKNISRSNGRSAVAAAAYRSGQRLWNVREERWSDFTNKPAVIHCEIFAPPGAPDWVFRREDLWNTAEAAEKRKDARLAKEVEFALPVELPRAGQMSLARQFADRFIALGLVVDLAVHDQGEGNPHVHMMLTTRMIDGQGFGKKFRNLDSRRFLVDVRSWWAALANAAFGAAGLDARIDHRTLEAQGIEREPETHRGPPSRKARRERARRRGSGAEEPLTRRDGHRPQPSPGEVKGMTKAYDALLAIERQLDDAGDDRVRVALEAQRARLLEDVRREEIEEGRGMGADTQRLLLDAWDAHNRPVPDREGRPVRPGSQEAASPREQGEGYQRSVEDGSEDLSLPRQAIHRRLGALERALGEERDEASRALLLKEVDSLRQRDAIMARRDNSSDERSDNAPLTQRPWWDRPERPKDGVQPIAAQRTRSRPWWDRSERTDKGDHSSTQAHDRKGEGTQDAESRVLSDGKTKRLLDDEIEREHDRDSQR